MNTAYTYDTASRLTGVNGIGYVLDANGNRIQMSDGEGVTTYSYDALDRLAQAAYPTSTVTYTLDSVGNRLSDGGNTFAYDPSDRITNPGYTYDANGNLLADGAATYEYDAANRLIQTAKDGVVTTYGHDSWGNLIHQLSSALSKMHARVSFLAFSTPFDPRLMKCFRSSADNFTWYSCVLPFSASYVHGSIHWRHRMHFLMLLIKLRLTRH